MYWKTSRHTPIQNVLPSFEIARAAYCCRLRHIIIILYTLTRSTDVGRRLRLLGCRFLEQPSSSAGFLYIEGGTGLGRIGIPDTRPVLGLCGTPAIMATADEPPDDLRPVAMSLANTMAAAAGAPDGCSTATLRFRTAVIPSITVACTAPFNSSPTTLGGPADRGGGCPWSAPGGIVNMLRGPTREDDDGNARGASGGTRSRPKFYRIRYDLRAHVRFAANSTFIVVHARNGHKRTRPSNNCDYKTNTTRNDTVLPRNERGGRSAVVHYHRYWSGRPHRRGVAVVFRLIVRLPAAPSI